MSKTSRYTLRGVSADKEEVHQAISGLDKGLFPNAFCKILPDIAGNDSSRCNIMHADTAGTKTSLAYLYYKETGDVNVWKHIAQDALVMNLDDMACVGCTDQIIVSSTIGRNKNKIPGEVLAAIIEGTQSFIESMRTLDIHITLAGGETADVGDIVRTIDVGITAFAGMNRNEVIEVNVRPGDVIVGLASYGQSTYEDNYNSGIGSNGLTSARHDVLAHHYAKKFPEAYDQDIPDDLAFSGSKSLTERDEETGLQIGQLMLSPTRTYLPVIKAILDQKPELHAIIHNTGGAHSKVLKFIKNLHIVKDNLLPVPPVFNIIKQESGTSEHEMYKVFNMGTRLEIYLPQSEANQVIDIAKSFNIEAKIIGYCEPYEGQKISIRDTAFEISYS